MKRFFRRRFYLRPLPVWSIGVVFVGLLAAVAVYANVQMRPILANLATARVSNTVNRIVSESVQESIANGTLSYDHLVSFEKDAEGRISAVQSNMVVFNQLQSQILDLILARMEQVSTRELSIPIGTLTGFSILAGRGPRITVRMESVGSSSAYFSNEFISAGINQTRHQIVLNIDVAVSILLPGFSTATVISNGFTVAETVIVGAVPDHYTQFGAETTTEDAKDYMYNDY